MFNYVEKLKDNVLIVYVTASHAVIKKRMIDSQHEEVDIRRDSKTFDRVYALMSCDKITIDTTEATVEECVKKILKKIKEIEDD